MKTMTILILISAVACARAHDTFAPDARADVPPFVGNSEASGNGRTLGPMPSLAPLVKELKPAVINIATATMPRRQRMGPYGEDPMQDFMRRFFGEVPEQQQARHALGSGFLIGDGLALTNNHVVEGADKIQVKTDDGQEFEAEIVGRDPKTDIAVIRLKGAAAKKLPAVKLGDSDATEVGDYVIAIGEPFGLQATVTSGIVSAKERRLPGGSPYEDFIQTDAAVNPGNSGGPLFNLRGEVIGMNTAIFNNAGLQQNVGIAFAVPVNLIKDELDQLTHKGKVVRGWLGVGIQEVTPDIAQALGLAQGTHGALVTQVFPNGPAAKAGLKDGDLILRFNGKSVKDQSELLRVVGSVGPGKTVPVKVLREGKEKSLDVTIAERTEAAEEAGLSGHAPEGNDPLGIAAQQVRHGVVIADVQPDGPAAHQGLESGDQILEINRQGIGTIADYNRAVRALGPGTTALVRVKRGAGAIYVAIPIPQK